MNDNESIYISDKNAIGFIKPYKDDKFSFVALLPNNGIKVEDYIASLTGDSFTNLIKNQSAETVITSLPKFKSEYNVHMVNSLKSMGINNAFDENIADFSKMANSDISNIFIGDIEHKTFIQVDELGTKAGAISEVRMDVNSM